MKTPLQERRRAELRRQHASLAEQMETAIDRLVRIAGRIAKVRRQLARYEKVKDRGQKGNTVSLTGVDYPPRGDYSPLPPDGDDIGI